MEPDATAQATDTVTDSLQPDAQQPNLQPPSQEQTKQDNSGFQRRIDELTARYRHAEDEVARKDAQLQEFTAAMLAQQVRGAVLAEPVPEVDPEERRRFEHLLNPLVQRMEQTQRLLERQLGQVQLQQTVQRVADPELAREAESLYQRWANNPDIKGFNADDAVIYATGKKALAAQLAARASFQGLQNFNNGAGPPMAQGRIPPGVAPLEPAVPADIDSWPIDKQADYWEKSLTGKTF